MPPFKAEPAARQARQRQPAAASTAASGAPACTSAARMVFMASPSYREGGAAPQFAPHRLRRLPGPPCALGGGRAGSGPRLCRKPSFATQADTTMPETQIMTGTPDREVGCRRRRGPGPARSVPRGNRAETSRSLEGRGASPPERPPRPRRCRDGSGGVAGRRRRARRAPRSARAAPPASWPSRSPRPRPPPASRRRPSTRRDPPPAPTRGPSTATYPASLAAVRRYGGGWFSRLPPNV